MKFTDEEIQLIIELITRHPPPSPAGTLFFLFNSVLFRFRRIPNLLSLQDLVPDAKLFLFLSVADTDLSDIAKSAIEFGL
jgi:hypothetical protein